MIAIIDTAAFVPAWIFKLVDKKRLKALRDKKHRKGKK